VAKSGTKPKKSTVNGREDWSPDSQPWGGEKPVGRKGPTGAKPAFSWDEASPFSPFEREGYWQMKKKRGEKKRGWGRGKKIALKIGQSGENRFWGGNTFPRKADNRLITKRPSVRGG